MYRNDGMVEVTACFGHLGHEVNSALLPLSKGDVEVVKAMLMAGICPEKIVSDLRSKYFLPNEAPQRQPRLYHLTVSDVINVADWLDIEVESDSDHPASPSTLKQESAGQDRVEEIFHEDDDLRLSPTPSEKICLKEMLDEALRETARFQAQISERAYLYSRSERLDLLEDLNGKLLSLLEEFTN
ncbi:unnamed protein product [Strongylus vulgaris]|uniref:Uncharacterized protein n=1 Tax=Strongylus vulgaris TaxID=40348 RepID=A0A3P7IM20_STRVU|nr:unnamed protein product [Strongylus vulgaris]